MRNDERKGSKGALVLGNSMCRGPVLRKSMVTSRNLKKANICEVWKLRGAEMMVELGVGMAGAWNEIMTVTGLVEKLPNCNCLLLLFLL